MYIQAHHLNLLTENHAWILPSYYNPNWWKQLTVKECDGQTKAEDILEGVIFVNTVKYPPTVSTYCKSSLNKVVGN